MYLRKEAYYFLLLFQVLEMIRRNVCALNNIKRIVRPPIWSLLLFHFNYSSSWRIYQDPTWLVTNICCRRNHDRKRLLVPAIHKPCENSICNIPENKLSYSFGYHKMVIGITSSFPSHIICSFYWINHLIKSSNFTAFSRLFRRKIVVLFSIFTCLIYEFFCCSLSMLVGDTSLVLAIFFFFFSGSVAKFNTNIFSYQYRNARQVDVHNHWVGVEIKDQKRTSVIGFSRIWEGRLANI